MCIRDSLDIETTVCNERFVDVDYRVCTTIVDPDGKEIGQVEKEGSLPIYGKDTSKSQIEIKDVFLWDCSNPYLYTAVTEIFEGDTLVDNYEMCIRDRHMTESS